jgi:hypothetical protein
MGYRNQIPDSSVAEKFDFHLSEVSQLMKGNVCYRFLPVSVSGSTVSIENKILESKSLSKNLDGCFSVCLFAATIGIEIDRLINKYKITSPSSALIVDCIGSAAVEALADYFNKVIQEKVEKEANFLRPRFSPGYGDFPLAYQRDFLQLVEASKYCGITLTDSDLMVPFKSVSALIGIAGHPTRCKTSDNSKCIGCDNFQCSYRG